MLQVFSSVSFIVGLEKLSCRDKRTRSEVMFVLRRLAAKHFTPRQDLFRTKKASFSSVDDALCTLNMCLCVSQDER